MQPDQIIDPRIAALRGIVLNLTETPADQNPDFLEDASHLAAQIKGLADTETLTRALDQPGSVLDVLLADPDLDNRTTLDPHNRACDWCSRFYDPAEESDADEIFCSEECRENDQADYDAAEEVDTGGGE